MTSVNLYSKEQIDALLAQMTVTVDDALSSSSTNPVQNKVIYDALQNVSIAIDSALSPTSENPVQNKVIYDALQNMANYVQDATPDTGDIGQLWYKTSTQTLYICTATTPVWTAIISGSGTTVAWGNITGTLADQTDLNTALSEKADVADLVQSNWNESDTSSLAYIQNKPTIPASPVQSNWNESDNTNLAYIQNKPTIPSVTAGTLTLAVADWSSDAQTKSVTGLTGKTIILSPAPSSYSDYVDAGIYVSAESGDNITFTCKTTPTNAITVNYVVVG